MRLALNHHTHLTTDSKELLRGILNGGASCAGMHNTWDTLDELEQRRLCADCPVANQCFEYGQAIGATETVFGGVMFGWRGRVA